MQTAISKQQLSLALAVVTCLSSYMTNISDLTSDFRGLLKKDTFFQWTETHVEIWIAKYQISKDVCLVYFNTSKDVILQVDTFNIGLGAVLLQESKPVEYALKPLTLPGTRYAHMQKCLQQYLGA